MATSCSALPVPSVTILVSHPVQLWCAISRDALLGPLVALSITLTNVSVQLAHLWAATTLASALSADCPLVSRTRVSAPFSAWAAVPKERARAHTAATRRELRFVVFIFVSFC